MLFLALGGVLFYWAISNEDPYQLWNTIKQANPFWIFMSMLAGIISHFLRALRWNLLLEPMQYKASVASSFHAVIIGYLVNMALPRVGEITRPAVLSKLEKIPFNKLVGTVLVERIVDLIITIILAMCIFIIQFNIIFDQVNELWGHTSLTQMGTIGIFFSIGIVILYWIYKKREWFYQLPIIRKFKSFTEGIIDGVKTVFSLKRKSLFMIYSIGIWIMYFLMPYFVFYALAGTSHLGMSAGLTVLLFGTAAMIVPIPGGVGTFEVLVPSALDIYNINELVAKSYTLITHAIQFIVIIGVGIISIFYIILKTRTLKKNDLE